MPNLNARSADIKAVVSIFRATWPHLDLDNRHRLVQWAKACRKAAIIKRAADGLKQAAIAAEFGLSQKRVSMILGEL